MSEQLVVRAGGGVDDQVIYFEGGSPDPLLVEGFIRKMGRNRPEEKRPRIISSAVLTSEDTPWMHVVWRVQRLRRGKWVEELLVSEGYVYGDKTSWNWDTVPWSEWKTRWGAQVLVPNIDMMAL